MYFRYFALFDPKFLETKTNLLGDGQQKERKNNSVIVNFITNDEETEKKPRGFMTCQELEINRFSF